MQRSDDLGELAGALSKAQGELQAASKSAKNPHLRSSYADLASCWAAIRAPLAAHGLSVVQGVAADREAVTVTTTLLHASGQWVASDLSVPWSAAKGLTAVQAVGSATTYARRYGLMAMVGIAPADEDDGAGAGAAPKPKPKQRKPKPPNTDHNDTWTEDAPAFCVRIKDLGGWAYEDIAAFCEWIGRPRPSRMDRDKRSHLLAYLESSAGQKKLGEWCDSARGGE